MDRGIFPDTLKIARVSPIFKSGDRTDPGNYRPISVLPTVSKIYEKVVYQQLVDYLDTVATFKYLGMIFEPQLLFKAHIDSLVEKTTNKLGLLYKTHWLFDKDTALMLFKSLITPHFDYGAVLYEVASQKELNRLQIVQNAAARMILLADARCPIYQLHEQLHLDTLATRRCKTMVKITYNKMPHYLHQQLKPVTHPGRATRATEAGHLEIPRVCTRYGQCVYRYRGPLQWNITSNTFKAATSKNHLKTLLKTSWYTAPP